MITWKDVGIVRKASYKSGLRAALDAVVREQQEATLSGEELQWEGLLRARRAIERLLADGKETGGG